MYAPLSQAFDTLNHVLLIEKINKYDNIVKTHICLSFLFPISTRVIFPRQKNAEQ